MAVIQSLFAGRREFRREHSVHMRSPSATTITISQNLIAVSGIVSPPSDHCTCLPCLAFVTYSELSSMLTCFFYLVMVVLWTTCARSDSRAFLRNGACNQVNSTAEPGITLFAACDTFLVFSNICQYGPTASAVAERYQSGDEVSRYSCDCNPEFWRMYMEWVPSLFFGQNQFHSLTYEAV